MRSAKSSSTFPQEWMKTRFPRDFTRAYIARTRGPMNSRQSAAPMMRPLCCPQSSPNIIASIGNEHAFSMMRRLYSSIRSSKACANSLSSTIAIRNVSIPARVHALSKRLNPRLVTWNSSGFSCDEPRVVGEAREGSSGSGKRKSPIVSRVILTLHTLPMSRSIDRSHCTPNWSSHIPGADLAPGARGFRAQDVEAVAELPLEVRVAVVCGHFCARRLGELNIVGDAVRLSMGQRRQNPLAVGHSGLRRQYRRPRSSRSTRGPFRKGQIAR